jgi:hypothetical protein
VELSIEISGDHRWSFAYAGTRRPIVKGITVHQSGALISEDIEIFPRVSFNFPLPEPLCGPWEGNKRIIESKGQRIGDSISWERVNLDLNYPLLGRLQEKVLGQIVVEIVNAQTDEVLAIERKNYELLAPNQWQFEASFHEVLSAFVIPSDAFVAEILKKARQLLQQRTGDSSTEGYQSEQFHAPNNPFPFSEHSRAYNIAKAIYDAISSMGYSYSNPQGNFDDHSQRVRTPSQIQSESCATCLDSAVLMAACFAQAGLEPVLFLIKGHAFAGYFTGRALTNASGQLVTGPNGQPVVGDRAVEYWKSNTGSIARRQNDYALIQHLLLHNHIQPVETTTTTTGLAKSFEEACQSQNNFSIKPVVYPNGVEVDDSTLESIIVVSKAWSEGITPPVSLADVPIHIGDWERNSRPKSASDSNINHFVDSEIELEDAVISDEERAIPPRIRQWMASLLDLGAKNPLLKMRANSVMEFDLPAATLGLIDDLLYTPKKRIELASPSVLPFDWVHNGVSEGEFETWMKKQMKLVFPSYKDLNGIQRSVENLVKALRNDPEKALIENKGVLELLMSNLRRNLEKPTPDALVNSFSDAELVKILREGRLGALESRLTAKVKTVQEKAKEVLLATGNNSMYLALGSISWTEISSSRGKGKETKWTAPLYLYPIILEGGKGSPFSIRLDPNGDATPNFCLHEKLKRAPYNIDLQELVNPEYDEKGIDFNKMITVIEARLKQAKLSNFAVQPRAAIGVFNYSTFRLWKDLRDSWGKMCQISPVVKHLTYTSNVEFQSTHVEPDPRLEPHLPIAADDSQRQAVQWALDGKSFRLEGPPGTGKSQTITNLLASCIAHNKKVLFVAEKETALNAVKDRLEATGLGKYTLNLHAKGDSDTKLRKTISESLTTALNQKVDPEDQRWDDLKFRIDNEEEILNKYRESLHELSENGFSAWSAHEEILLIGEGETLDVPGHFVTSFASIWPQLREIGAQVENSLELVGDPHRHPWKFVTSGDISENAFPHISKILQELLHQFSLISSYFDLKPQLRHQINPVVLTKIAAALRLHHDGVLPSITKLRDLPVQSLTSQIPFHEHADASEFIARARHISSLIQSHTAILSPEIVKRSDIPHLSLLLSEMNNPAKTQILNDLLDRWKSLVQDASKIDAKFIFRPFTGAEEETITSELVRFDSQSESQEFGGVILQAQVLEGKVRMHEHNVNPNFLSRTDILNIGIILKDAEDAGALSRRRRFKELRDALGTDARAIDDRMLVLSLTEMIGLVADSENVKLSLRSKFPDLYTQDFQPWNSTHTSALADLFKKNRYQRVRNCVNIENQIIDDEEYVQNLRRAIELSGKIRETLQDLHAKFPDFSSDAWKPWVTTEQERLRASVRSASIRSLRAQLGDLVLTNDDEQIVTALQVWLNNLDEIRALQASIGNSFLPGYSKDFSAWSQSDVEKLEDIYAELIELKSSLNNRDFEVLEFLLSLVEQVNIEIFVTASEAWKAFVEFFDLDQTNIAHWLNGRPLINAIEDEVPSLIRDGGSNNRFLNLSRWMELQRALTRLADLGLASHCDRLKNLEIDVQTLLTDVRRSAMQQSLRERLQERNLDRFDRKIHERRIATYEAALKESQALLQSRIPGLVNRRQSRRRTPTGKDIGATSSLLAGLKPVRGDKTPIRDLISKYGNALADAIPCLLMSPDSVATLVPVGSIDFDVVVFDEASQVRTAHAVGALGRGKAGIVVGDSRQMPPSNVFSSNSGAFVEDDFDDDLEEDEEDVVAEDTENLDEDPENSTVLRAVAMVDEESILKEFYAAQLPNMQLLCHYRSKDELLISFSNTHIYDEPMLTFPSTKGLESTSLSYRVIEGGQFERNVKAPPHVLPNNAGRVPSLRTNLAEATAIVEEVYSRMRDPERRRRRANDPEKTVESFIIVTFNVQQRNLITELFRATDPGLYEEATKEEKINEDGEETFPPQLKIRNLENVQGDEAETVIFSAAFSPTPDGKFPLNWGPVSQSGGDRKLNVAVTRAQREMIVFASFYPDQMIPASKKPGPEIVLLQKFFQLAYKGANSSGDVGVPVKSSRHIEAIARAIRDHGYRVQTQMGLSTLRVDLAVKNPDSSDWELAIMVDDTCWADRGSAFQREVLPRQILPGLGWKKVLRIWLPTWIHDRDEILEEIDLFFAGNVIPEAEPDVGSPVPPKRRDTPDKGEAVTKRPDDTPRPYSEFKAYSPDVIDAMYILDQAIDGDPESRDYVRYLINQALVVEGPIESERLAKMVCKALNFGRVSPDRIKQVLSFVPKKQITKDIVGRFVWHESLDPDQWKFYRTSIDESVRSSDEISYTEYVNALIHMIENHLAVSSENTVRELAATFGFRKLNANVRTLIEKVLARAVKDGKVLLIDGEYRSIK